MKRPQPTLFEIQRLVVDLALVNRNHHLAGQARNENDIEHSFAVAMLCWFIASKNKLPLDISKVLKYALSHDFVERYAGDVNTFASDSDRAKKAKAEKDALQRFNDEFRDFDDLRTIMNAYEDKLDEEALFVWTVDKMQALILGDMDGWRPYKNIKVTYGRFVEKHSEQLVGCSPFCKQIFADLLDYCKTTFYDQPEER